MSAALKRPAAMPPVVSDALTSDGAGDPLESLAASVLLRLPVGIVIQRTDGSIVDANDAACTILRLSMDQLCGRTSMDPTWQAVRADGSPLPGEEHPAMRTLRSARDERETMGVRTPTGEMAWIDVVAKPILDSAGTLAGVYTTFADVSEEHAAHANERRTRLRYERIASEASDVMAALDGEGRITYMTPSTSRILGRDPQSMVGGSVLDVFDDEHRPGIGEMITSVMVRPGASDRRTVAVSVPGDGTRWFEIRATNYLDDPVMDRVLVTFIDVDDRVVAETELRRVNADLERRLDELDRAARLEAVLGTASELLVRCTTLDEVGDVLWDCLSQAFPDGSLSLQLTNGRSGLLRPFRHRTDDFGPVRFDDCWATRTKHVHLNEAGGVHCDHDVPEGCSACVPFVADGQVVATAVVERADLDCDQLAAVATMVANRVATALPPAVLVTMSDA